MNKSLVTAIAFSLLAAPVFAQQPPAAPAQTNAAAQAQAALQRSCANQPCQRNVPVTIRDLKGATYTKTFDLLPPAVQNDGVLVMAGQRVYFEGALANGRVAALRHVNAITQPARTMSATLSQLPDGRMQYVLTNPFAQPIKFEVGVTVLGSNRTVRTASCPILPGKSGTIIWDQPVLMAIAAGGVAITQQSQMNCS